MELTNKNVSHLRREERIYMIKVMETTKFLARQGIPFRGNIDFESNFTQALLLRGTEDPQLKQRVFSIRSDNMLKYTHQDFQNELVDLMSKQVLSKLMLDIKEPILFYHC